MTRTASVDQSEPSVRGSAEETALVDRRGLLEALTADQLTTVIREHYAAGFIHCWGWGAVAGGLREGQDVPTCVDCGKPAKHPLWFRDETQVLGAAIELEVARDSRCAAIRHLTSCDRIEL